jgi:hypothetical protein
LLQHSALLAHGLFAPMQHVATPLNDSHEASPQHAPFLPELHVSPSFAQRFRFFFLFPLPVCFFFDSLSPNLIPSNDPIAAPPATNPSRRRVQRVNREPSIENSSG